MPLIKHRMEGTPEYWAWGQMKRRCYNPRSKNWANYGARGITVCDRWLNSFENFYADLGPRPATPFGMKRQYMLERIDNNGHYEPHNCRWATAREQGNNRRTNTLLTFNGITRSIAEWARAINLDPNVLYTRFRKGWSLERALTTPHRWLRRR